MRRIDPNQAEQWIRRLGLSCVGDSGITYYTIAEKQYRGCQQTAEYGFGFHKAVTCRRMNSAGSGLKGMVNM